MIRVIVVNDHPVVREGLVAVLGGEPDLLVVGSAASAEPGLALVERERPDIVLLDLELPEIDGVTATSRFIGASKGTRVIAFTAYATDDLVLGAIRAGASGYVLKGATAAEIARAIRVVHEGGCYLEPRVAARIVAEVGTPRRAASALSERERSVLRLVAAGLPTKQIAHSLSISERTVKFHLRSIFNKLGADNRAQAVALAGQRGLL